MKKSTFSRSSRRALLLAALALGSAQAGAAELIQNGGFESFGANIYSPTSWSVFESLAPHGVMVDNSHLSPSGYATTGAASGSYYGLIDSYNHGAFTLSQSFTTSAVSQAQLSFQMFVNDNSVDGDTYIGADLDVSKANSEGTLLNFARVDILKAGAAPDATGSDVVTSIYIGGATGRKFGTQSNKYTTFSYDLSSVLATGGDYTLRFAVASNLGAMQLGVDNVSLSVTAVPEPDSSALMLAGLGVIGAMALRRTRG